MKNSERKTIESQLFTWEEWDAVDEGVYDFSGVALVLPIFPFGSDNNEAIEVGHKFSHAVVDFQHSSVTFYDEPEDEVGLSFELWLSVGRRV